MTTAFKSSNVNRERKGSKRANRPSLNDVTDEWKTEFSQRPSWCDAAMVLTQLRRGRAKGGAFKVAALTLRALMQRCLFTIGCFIQRYACEVLFLSMLLFAVFCIGLKDVRVQTDIVKLWVESKSTIPLLFSLPLSFLSWDTFTLLSFAEGGRLDDEMGYRSYAVGKYATVHSSLPTAGNQGTTQGSANIDATSFNGDFQVCLCTVLLCRVGMPFVLPTIIGGDSNYWKIWRWYSNGRESQASR